MNKKLNFLVMLVCLLALSLVFIGCGNKSGGGGKANPASDFSYDLTEDGQGIIIKGYTGSGEKIVVPAKIEDIPVTEIGEDSFNGENMTFSLDFNSGTASSESKTNARAGITSITIPNTVTKIGSSAFANTAITSFNMPDSVVELGKGAFSGCKSLVELKLSDNITLLRTVGGSVFGGAMTSLKKANLPAKLEKIAGGLDNGFLGCGELTELIIPDNIQSIEFVETDFTGKWVKLGDNDLWYIFKGCGKLPIKTRQRLKDLGYKGEF